MTNLSEKLGDSRADGPITDIKPPVIVRGGTIRKLSAAGTLTRGTILAKSTGSAKGTGSKQSKGKAGS